MSERPEDKPMNRDQQIAFIEGAGERQAKTEARLANSAFIKAALKKYDGEINKAQQKRA
jgi:hypothetical protein